MKIRKSIVSKIFILTAIVFLLFIVVELLLQTFFFDTFYVSRKLNAIEKQYAQIESVIENDQLMDYEILSEIDQIAYESNVGVVISDEMGGIVYPNVLSSGTDNFILLEDEDGELFTIDTSFMEYENGQLAIRQGDVIEIFGEVFDEDIYEESQSYIYPYQIKSSNDVYNATDLDELIVEPGIDDIELNSIVGEVVYYLPSNVNQAYEINNISYKVSWLYNIVDSAIARQVYGNVDVDDDYVIFDENTGFENLVFEKTATDSFGNKYYTFIMTPLQSVNEAMVVLKDYYVYMFLIALVFIAIMSYVLSKIISKPLLEINEKTELMANMDFESKCEVRGEDEIGTLSKNINSMSENLSGALSNLKTANDELQKDIEKEKKREQERKDFIANASHELKTPLSIIKSYSEGLIDGVYKDNQGYYLDIIKDEVSKMDDLIQSMLELSKVESSEVKISPEVFNIDELIQTTIEKFSHDLTNKAINVAYTSKEIDVYADKRRYEQVITNLISNGIKYSPQKESIHISLKSQTDNRMMIYIENTGTNIPEEEIEHIWKGFYRVDKSRNREHGGNGLGLRVVKEIIEAHNETYGVKNTGQGVLFWVSITKA